MYDSYMHLSRLKALGHYIIRYFNNYPVKNVEISVFSTTAMYTLTINPNGRYSGLSSLVYMAKAACTVYFDPPRAITSVGM